MRTIFLSTCFLALSCSGLLAQENDGLEPQEFDPASRATEFAPIASEVSAVNTFRDGESLTIKGEYRSDSYLVTAPRIVFEPGSRIIFTSEARNLRDEFFIVANIIETPTSGSPPSITWEASVPAAPGGRGQASTGASARGWGGHGSPGATGAVGNPGGPGQVGPDITLFITEMQGGALVINAAAGAGGPGGPGQKGGDGSAGYQGQPAENERVLNAAVSCKRGPGRGGNGGAGGRGGVGGTGGVGGRGGDVTLVSIPEALPSLTQKIRIDLSGGQGGQGGPAGAGGSGGAAGPEGSLTTFCRSAGRVGSPGSNGPGGSRGANGAAGDAGDFYVGSLPSDRFNNLFNF